MINFDAVDFSECRSKEVTSSFDAQCITPFYARRPRAEKLILQTVSYIFVTHFQCCNNVGHDKRMIGI